MKKGYWMGSVTITDPEAYRRYGAANGAAFTKYGAKFLARGGAFEGPEGPVGARNVIIEFESFAVARDCYNSPEYQAALKDRLAGADTHFVIVEGVE